MYKTKLKFISIFISGLVVFFVLFNTDLLAIDKEFHPAEVTVEQTTTSIKIAWENTASEYYVYLDDKKIEKIVSPSTTIKNLESDHPYSIRIQALEDGEIVDNMVVQTKTRMNTTDKKQKKFENEEGLTTAIFTDHEAKVMFEQPLDNDGKFEVLRDQKKIGTINKEKNSIIDLNLKPETSYRYSIVGEVPLKENEKKAVKAELKRYPNMSPKAIDVNDLNKQHQLARTFKTLKKEQKDSVNAVFKSETSDNPDLGVEFTYSTFIEPEFVLFYIPKLSDNVIYKGDGRDFDEHNLKHTKFRTKTWTRVSFPAGGGSVIRFKHKQNDTTHVNTAGRWETTPNPQKGISIKMDPRSDRAFFTINHAATNPAHKLAGVLDAPPIDYVVNGEVYKNGLYELTGFHDKAPNHEMTMTKVPGEVHLDDNTGKVVFSSYTHLFKDKIGPLGFNELWSWAEKISINEQGFWK